MKRFWICAAILTAIFLAALGNGRYLDTLTEGMAQSLEQAQVRAEAGDWSAGQTLTGEAMARWERSSGYLHVVLRHSEADDISAGFQEVRQLLQWQEEAEYTSANARLIQEIRLLADMERFNLRNLF